MASVGFILQLSEKAPDLDFFLRFRFVIDPVSALTNLRPMAGTGDKRLPPRLRRRMPRGFNDAFVCFRFLPRDAGLMGQNVVRYQSETNERSPNWPFFRKAVE